MSDERGAPFKKKGNWPPVDRVDSIFFSVICPHWIDGALAQSYDFISQTVLLGRQSEQAAERTLRRQGARLGWLVGKVPISIELPRLSCDRIDDNPTGTLRDVRWIGAPRFARRCPASSR